MCYEAHMSSNSMKTVSVRLDGEVKARWDELARRHGINPSRLMREAINDRLEELEDFYIVRSRLAEPFDPISNEDVWKRLGLED
jgi:RHH-type transcriptional regulator, rel operon repressor / antitoxin RelB